MTKSIILILAAILCVNVFAAERIQSWRPVHSKTFQEVADLHNKWELAQAESLLADLPSSELNNYERATLYKLYADIALKRHDLLAAAKWAKKSSALEEGVVKAFTENMNSLQAMVSERIAKRTSEYERLSVDLNVAASGEDAATDEYAALARAAFELGKKDQSDALLANAIRVYGIEGLPEKWLKLYIDDQIAKGANYQRVRSLYETMANRYPTRNSWKELVNVYFSSHPRPKLFQGDFKFDNIIVEAYEQMYRAGFLEGDEDYTVLFTVLYANKQYGNFVDFYRDAEEAGKFEETIELKKRYVHGLSEVGRWEQVIEQNTELVTEDPRNAGDYWLAIGSAQEELGEYIDAKESYKFASKFKQSQKQAKTALKALKKKEK